MNILLIDEQGAYKDLLIVYLELEKIFDKVFSASEAERIEEILTNSIVDIVLFDIPLIGKNGFDIASFTSTLSRKPILVMLTNYTDPSYKRIYGQMGIDYFFDKTYDLKKIKRFLLELTGRNKNDNIKEK